MQPGSMDATYKMMDLAVKNGVAEKYDVVVKAREPAARLGMVEAYR